MFEEAFDAQVTKAMKKYKMEKKILLIGPDAPLYIRLAVWLADLFLMSLS
jgi:hypothetical protein